jgi:pyruvate dehydrogenase E1 component alpha subunit
MPAPLAIEMLRRMKLIRGVEETIAARYAEQKMRCPTHLSTGQETVAAAAGVCLTSADYAVSTHRSHAHYLGKGGSLRAMIAEIYGKATGCSRGKGGSMHLIDLSVGFLGSTAIVANSIPVGVGAALSSAMLKQGRVSCVFFGDAAIEEGVFHEALNFAVLRRLPVLFVCENNLYSVYSPLSVRQPEGREIARFARAYGVPALRGDGYDPHAAFAILQTAVEHARAGRGPYFVELLTYRWREHCGPHFDNDIGYRSPLEYEAWRRRDPIPAFQADLQDRGALTAGDVSAMDERIAVDIRDAFQFAEASPFPDPSEMLTGVFAPGD